MKNRTIKLPPPPSQRRGWEDRLCELVLATLNLLVDQGETDAGVMRETIIGTARIALGETPTAELVNRMSAIIDEATPGEPKNLEGLAGLLRVFIENDLPNWSDSWTVESVMAVIQRALDAEFSHRLEGFTRVLAARLFAQASDKGMRHRPALVNRLMATAREAVAGSWASHEILRTDRGTFAAPIAVLGSIVRGFDLANPDIARSVLEMIEQAARDELNKPIPGTKRRGA